MGDSTGKNKKFGNRSHYIYENKGTIDKMPEKRWTFLYKFRTFWYNFRTFLFNEHGFVRKSGFVGAK